MRSRFSMLRRMTIFVAVAALAGAAMLIGAGSPAANAKTAGTPTAWRQAIMALAVPGQGCFTASYPALQWKATTCAKVHPKVPQQFAGFKPGRASASASARVQQVGGCSDNSCDYAAQTAASQIEADGTFPTVTCASSPCESGQFGGAGPALNNVYSLQLNTNYNLPATASCSGALVPAACTGWQQFVYDSDLAEIQVEPALIGYNNTCVYPFDTPDFAGDCYDENEVATPVPALTPQQLNTDAVTFSGLAGVVGGVLTDTVRMVVSSTAYAATAADSLVNLSGSWKISQFGLYGDRGGGGANFIAGSDVKVHLTTHSGTTAAPTCIMWNSTGEYNNLYLQPSPALGTGAAPYIQSDQASTAPSSPPSCSSGNGWGEIHVNTFGCATCSTHLSYNFQGTGDYWYANAPGLGGSAFEVQSRLQPFAANPNLSVSQEMAAQVGSSQVALCNGTPMQLMVNKNPVVLGSGGRIALAGGGSVTRQGNVYVIRDGSGDSVQTTQNSYLGVTYLDTYADLGRWPTSVSGLLANAPGSSSSSLVTAGGTVLTAPFSFSTFYPEYGDSWRVAPSQDLLSPCGTNFTTGDPTVNYEASSLPSSEYQTAHATCVSAGVESPALLDACTLDVAVLGSGAVKVYQGLPTNLTWGQISG